ncbi:MAG TPA: shikimate kinase [Phycisphaerae bacterium]|nr:shikimate kinase [Phycisphaerae bacterium]HOJ72980.1 shikimate kinase [Phycisphaerae bacterium]HOM50164.1 shikimate kinase [Phycisphaerae bacterium]HON65276.1 shikimate kinase [Phycisphaerae bacterium]HOQ84317.1 shikimate kinase [Phycisphaerae bacterium]
MNLVLVGYRGSGKTTVGRALAERLGWPFLDTDQLIEQRMGKTIREIYADRGEPGFRELEAEVVAEAARLDRHVISTGGGVVLREDNVRALRATGQLIYLTAPPEILWHRIYGDAHRHVTRLPMDPKTGLQQVRNALIERDPIYRQASHWIVDTHGCDIESVLNRVLWLTGLTTA